MGLPHTSLIAPQVGQDANSAMLKESLLKCGVDLAHLREVEGPCGTALILLQDSGGKGRRTLPLRDPPGPATSC